MISDRIFRYSKRYSVALLVLFAGVAISVEKPTDTGTTGTKGTTDSESNLAEKRKVKVTGEVKDGSSKVQVEVIPENTLPGTAKLLTLPVADEEYSGTVDIFPGNNTIRATTEKGEKTEKNVKLMVDAPEPKLRVRLEWAGKYQDYDLYVNQVWYGSTSAGGGVLDRDAIWDYEPTQENITFANPKAGLYNIYVSYYSDNDWESDYWPEPGEPSPNALPTTIKIYYPNDATLIHTETKTLTYPDWLGEIAGDGKSVWNVGTLVVHSAADFESTGNQIGAYIVKEGLRDIEEQGKFSVGVSPRTDYEVTALTGPNGTNDVFLAVGDSAQFSAKGTVNKFNPEYPHSNQVTGVNLIDVFATSGGVGLVDATGVFTGTSAGSGTVTAGDLTVNVHVIGVQSIYGKRKGSSDSLDSTSTIAAGGISSDVHTADVELNINTVPYDVTWSVQLPISLNGANGKNVDGKLYLPGTTLTGNSRGYVTISNSDMGTLEGSYKSCDRIQDAIISSSATGDGSGATAIVKQKWDIAGAYDFDYPTLFAPGVPDDIRFFPTLNKIEGESEEEGTLGEAGADGAIDGHTITYFTYSVGVEYWEINWNDLSYNEGYEEFINPDDANIDIMFDKKINDLVKYSQTTEIRTGVYENTQTVLDFFGDSSSSSREIIVWEYDFAVRDKSVFTAKSDSSDSE